MIKNSIRKKSSKELFLQVGIKTVFDSSKAQLSGMTDPDQPLYVSEARQKSSLSLDEDGSVAVAANGKI